MSVIEADNMIEIAKASTLAYNHKDWQKAKESMHHDAVYDEKATHRRIEGRDDIITAWRGWAKAFPDSKATFVREHQTGNIVVLEVVWKGIHSGPLDMPRDYPGIERCTRHAVVSGVRNQGWQGRYHHSVFRSADHAAADRSRVSRSGRGSNSPPAHVIPREWKGPRDPFTRKGRKA